MTRGSTLAAQAGRRLHAAGLVTLLLLLVNMYLLRLRVLSDVVAVCVTGVAILALVARAEPWNVLRAMLAWLGLAVLLLLGSSLASPGIGAVEGLRGIQSLALIACFLLFARVLFRTLGTERVMWLLFLAGAACALLSVAIHLATAPDITERLAMLGRGRNPIPAAAAIAAAGLAGLALLRAGPQPALRRVLGAVGLAGILVAMLLTQSRGPLIGAALGAVLLLLPWRGAALTLGWALPPFVFGLASSLILAEDQLKALFCAGDNLFCRPSMRLPLWEQSLALIAAHPLTGMGTGYQLGEGWLNNPQNAMLGTAVYFGLPFLCASLLALALLLRRLASREPTVPLRWAGAMMVFSAAYFAFEPNPFAFYNAHYLFFWLPVAVILSAEQERAR